MKITHIIAVLLVVIGFSSQAQADLFSNQTTSNPIMDGVVSPGEWNSAGMEYDGNGLAGATYAMWQDGLNYGSWSYSGKFSFLLHNIEQNTTYSNGLGGTDPAFNVFDIFTPSDPTNIYLEVTVRYDGFSVDKYDTAGNVIDTRNFDYGVDLAPEQTASYDWNNYFGVYARGGFGNTAFTSGLKGAIDNDNQLFEVAYLDNSFATVRRSIKDPDQKDNSQVATFLDTYVIPTPEPTAMILFGVGLAGLISGRARKRRK